MASSSQRRRACVMQLCRRLWVVAKAVSLRFDVVEMKNKSGRVGAGDVMMLSCEFFRYRQHRKNPPPPPGEGWA